MGRPGQFGRIEVNGMRFDSNHGCMIEEGVIGGAYRVDVCIETDLRAAVASDDLVDTIDYCAVHSITAGEMAIRSKLIEHVGGRIAASLRAALPSAERIEVKVTKYAPPIGGDVAEVAIVVEG